VCPTITHHARAERSVVPTPGQARFGTSCRARVLGLAWIAAGLTYGAVLVSRRRAESQYEIAVGVAR
jgi:hypothetical protein